MQRPACAWQWKRQHKPGVLVKLLYIQSAAKNTRKGTRKMTIEPEELERLRQDLAAATEENADLLSRLQTCQELSGGVLPMSDSAVKAGRLFLKRLSSFVDSGQAGLPIRLHFSATEAELLVDALRPLFGDAGAA